MRTRLTKTAIQGTALHQARYRAPEIFVPTAAAPRLRQRDSKQQPIVYPPFGRCMYCGCARELSAEHIIPRGLGGNIVFPRSSCEKCRQITHAFETICMRKNFLYFRIHNNFHQHPKERPSHLRIRLATQGNKEVLPSAHPNWLGMPLFMAPGIFVNAPLGMPYILKGLHITNPRNLHTIQTQYNERFYVDYNLDIDAFAKMLAKIAHGLACGMLHHRT
jgi:hypothetical protein